MNVFVRTRTQKVQKDSRSEANTKLGMLPSEKFWICPNTMARISFRNARLQVLLGMHVH